MKQLWVAFGIVLCLFSLASVARAQETISLEYVQDGTGAVRLGVYANIGGAAGSGTTALPEMYLLDTGSPNFISDSVSDSSNAITGYGGAWWGTVGATLSGSGVNYTYYDYASSGTVQTGSEQLSTSRYDYNVAQAQVTVTGTPGWTGTGYTTSSPVIVNQATAYTDQSGSNTLAAWQATDGQGYPPESNLFYGTFGSDLETPTAGMYSMAVNYATSYNSTPAGISHPVATGFIIQVNKGTTTGTLTTGSGTTTHTFTTLGTATLTLGVSGSTLANYEQNGVVATMKTGTGMASGTNASYGEKILPATEVTYTLFSSSGTYSFRADTILDTGEGDPTISNVPSGSNFGIPTDFLDSGSDALADGVTFTMSVTGTGGNSYEIYSLTQGDTNPYVNIADETPVNIAVNYTAGDGNVVNASIDVFEANNVMFDTSDGLVGFMAVPEPGSLTLLLAGVVSTAVALSLRRKTCERRHSI